MDKYVKDSDIYDIVMSQFCASSDETEAALNAIIEETRALPPADVRPVVRGGSGQITARFSRIATGIVPLAARQSRSIWGLTEKTAMRTASTAGLT